MSKKPSMRTPLARVRYLGAAHSGTEHFWRQRVTSVALIPLSIGLIFIVIFLLGRNHAATVQILGSPWVAIVTLLFIISSAYHMWLGMQVIIEDYVHTDLKLTLIMANAFFSFSLAIACIFAVFKLSFGV